jgi:tRNA (guanine-N7-)-methyltransferase
LSRGPRRNPGWVTPPPDFPDPLVGLADHPAPLPLEKVFGRRAPLEVEIGSGKGNTLVQLASERPDVDFLGIEIGVKWVRLSRARLIRAGLANVRVVTGDAQWILARHLPAGSVQRVHVYFPDPWPKKRHAKRRLFRKGFPDLLKRCLVAQGDLRVATDHESYGDQIVEVLEAGGFVPILDAAWDDSPVSAFERKYREQGRTIRRQAFRPCVDAPPGG